MPVPQPIRIAVIGTEFMGRAHSQAWRSVRAFADVRPVILDTIVGRDHSKTVAAAEKLGWQTASTNWREVIERDDIDVVDICTPGHLHAEIAIAALNSGKHVIVEKPLASSLEDATAMVTAATAASAAGIHSMVGFTYRRVPALAHAREIVRSGRIGTVRQVRACFLQDWLADASAPMSWRLRREIAGAGVTGDLGSHLVDQVQFLLDEPITSVSAHERTFVEQRPNESGQLEDVTVDDAFWAIAETESGVVVSLEASRVATGRKSAMEIEIYGSTGAIRFDLERLNELWVLDESAPVEDRGFRRVLVTEASHPYVARWWPPGHTLGWEDTFVIQAGDFLEAIQNGTPAAPSFADALAVQVALEAIGTSAASAGARVQIERTPR